MESLQWNNYTTILTGITSSRISYQLRDIYSMYRYCWNVATYKWKVYNGTIILLSWQEPQALEYRIIWEIYYTLYTGTAGMLYQQRDIYSIYRYCWNVATYKWKVYNRTIILLSWQEPQALEYRIIWEIYTLYTGATGMLLHINGKFTIQQLYYCPDRNHKFCNILSTQRYILYIQVLLECWYI
jgi:hypothetical protein